MATDSYDNYFTQLEGQVNGIQENGLMSSPSDNTVNDKMIGMQNGFHSTSVDGYNNNIDVRNMNFPDNVYITEPPKQGG